VLADEEFRRGAVGTDFLNARHAQLQFSEPEADAADMALAGLWCATRRTDHNALWEDSRGWRMALPAHTSWRFAQGQASIEQTAAQVYLARAKSAEYGVRVLARTADSLLVECQGRVQRIQVIDANGELHLFTEARHVALKPERTEDTLQAADSGDLGSLLTPLPGTIVAVHIAAGQHVVRGAPLVTVEAMKMEHTLTAPYDGVVSRIAFGLGDRVQAGAILVELAALEK
jgi:acetyl/propionyl-CoA carboxylase alpha subunit